jgi:hypothetical protein
MKNIFKITLIIGSLLFSNMAIAQNEIKMSDKEEMFGRMKVLIEVLHKADGKGAVSLFSPNNKELQNEIYNLAQSRIDLYVNFKSIEKVEGDKIKINVTFDAEGSGWNVSGMSAYFTFEQYRGYWLISDTNIHEKANSGYVFKMIGLIFLIIAPFAIFWFWMLADCIKNEEQNKLAGIFLIIFLSVIGAAIYFFMFKRKR